MKMRIICYTDVEMTAAEVVGAYSIDPDNMPSGAELAEIIRKDEHAQAMDTLIMGDNKIAIQINDEITEIPQTQED